MAAPTVTSVTPTASSTAGGKTATVVGTGFTGVTGVKVGGKTAKYKVTDATHLTLVLPSRASGAAQVVVTNADGPSTSAVSVTYSASYSQVNGTKAGKRYFHDVEIGPASLKDGSLVQRLDPVLYPGIGRTGVAKVGKS